MTHPTNLSRRLSREDQPLLGHSDQSVNSNPAPRKGRTLGWIAAGVPYIGGAGWLGYNAVKAFMDNRVDVGLAFGAGALLCVGSCSYCVFRVLNSLKTRQIAPIQPSGDVEAAKANQQMLIQIDNRLKAMLPSTEMEEVVLDNPAPDLHQSINEQFARLETLYPELCDQVGELQGIVQRMLTLETSPTASPGAGTLDSPIVAEASLDDGLRLRLNALAKKVGRDQSSRNTSTLSNSNNSNAGRSSLSNASVSRGSLGGSSTSLTTTRRITFESPDKSGTQLGDVLNKKDETVEK